MMAWTARALLMLTLLGGVPARALPPLGMDDTVPPPDQATTTTPPPTTPPPRNLDFELFGDGQKQSPLDEAREQLRLTRLQDRVRLRRRLLGWHQALGFGTLAALAAADVIGTLNYYDKYAVGGGDTGRFATWHEGLGIGTTAAFAVTGILALAAPNPYPKPLKLDAALTHKLMMALATACFVAEAIMGPIIAISDGKLYQRDLALAHLVIGYGAFAFMGAGTLAFVF